MARYGRRHHELRLRLLPSAYGTPCVRCGELMKQGQKLDLDHDERDASGLTYRGFSHSSCNRSTAGHNPKGVGERNAATPAARSVTRW